MKTVAELVLEADRGLERELVGDELADVWITGETWACIVAQARRERRKTPARKAEPEVTP